MNAVFWTFCTLLITLTLISAFGGGIRYRENFLSEVFDNSLHESERVSNQMANELLETLTFDQTAHMMNPQMVEDEIAANLYDESIDTVNTMTEPEEPETINDVKTIPTTMMTQDTTVPKAMNAVIEAFDGDMFASF